MVLPVSASPNTSSRRARSWLVFSSPVSTTRSARSRRPASSARSSAMESTTPRAAWGWRRRVPSKRRISTSSAASRNRMRTRLRPAISASTAGSTSSRSPPPRPTTKATRFISEPAPSTSSETLAMSAEGMLSITNQPRSSSVAAAVDRPAPDIPVTTRYSLMGPLSVSGASSVGRQRRVEPLVDGTAHGRRQPRYAHQVVTAGPAEPGEATELLHQPGPPLGPEPRHAVEGADGHPLAPQRPVVGDGEAVGLVPQPLQEVQRLGLAWQAHRLGRARQVHLLETLGQGGDGHPLGQAQVVEDPHADVELPEATVHQEELRRVGEPPPGGRRCTHVPGDARRPGGIVGALLVEQGREPPGEDLLHRRVVIVAGNRRHLEVAVVALLGQSVLEHDHGAHVVGSLEVAHVVALDP